MESYVKLTGSSNLLTIYQKEFEAPFIEQTRENMFPIVCYSVHDVDYQCVVHLKSTWLKCPYGCRGLLHPGNVTPCANIDVHGLPHEGTRWHCQ